MVNELLARLYDDKYNEVKRYFSKNFNGDTSLADDLAQECFYRLLKHSQKYGDKDTNKNYLFKIAQNVKYDHMKRKAGMYFDSILDVVVACDLDIPLSGEIEISIDGLKTSEKILLSFIRDGLKSHEIAKLMKITPSAVRARTNTLRKKLKTLLK